MSTATRELAVSTGGVKPTSKFRLDIEGLRAIAVVFVVVWHAGVTQLPGGFVGVDVFFVISGFLMTGILYRELGSSGRVQFGDFFARRVKRLLPASSLTLLVTLIAAWIVLPTSRVVQIAYDSIAAALYVVNWRLADGAVDYFAQDSETSPIQHFWSLSVEEQFYIFWPVMMGALGLLIAMGWITARKAVTGALTVIFVVSLGWSIYYTNVNPGAAYFVTTTRVWELALGGLVAVLLTHRDSFPKLAAAVGSWIGLVAVIASGLLLTTSMAFPGYIALLPTIGTALLIALTPSAGTSGPGAVLSLRPLTWLGSISYSLYLWHWPFIVIGAQLITQGAREATVTEGVCLAALSVLPAWLSLKYVEDPLRRGAWVNERRTHTFFMGLVVTGTVLAVSMYAAINLKITETIATAQASSSDIAQAATGRDSSRLVGAELLAPDPNQSVEGRVVDSVEAIYPRPAAAKNSHSRYVTAGCAASVESSELKLCDYGDMDSDFTVAILGDSHAGNWAPALISAADDAGWHLQVATKGACPLTTATIIRDGADYTACSEWNARAFEYLTGPDKPDALVLTHSSYASLSRGGEASIVTAGVELVDTLTKSGVEVVVLQDTPFASFDIAECVESNQERLSRCAVNLNDATPVGARVLSVIATRTDTPVIDLTDWICPSQTCPAVIGGILVWKDNNHLTVEYSRTLAGPLGEALGVLR